MSLGDCTFLYVIFRDCTLANVKINAESVGAILGLTKEQLLEAGMLYLGNEQPIPLEANLIDSLFDEYGKRKWWLGESVLKINFDLEPVIAVFESYLSDSYERFVKLGFAKGDELEFLGDIIQELAFHNRLPFITVLNILEWCGDLEATISQENANMASDAGSSLQTLASRTALLTNSLLEKFERSSIDAAFTEHDREICTKATFQERPELSFSELLNSIGEASMMKISRSSSLLGVEKGSYIEIVYTTLLTILAFQLFLFLVNGCIIQLTELKQRVKVLARKEGPKNYKKIAISPTQQVSPLILTTMQSLTKYAAGLPWLKGVFMAGYSPSNIESLQEIECKNRPDA
jgi:hypothetical protein